MITINQQTKRVATWLSRPKTAPNGDFRTREYF